MKRFFFFFKSVDDTIFILLSMVHWHDCCSHWVRDGCSAVIFVMYVKAVFIQVLSCSRQCSVDAWIAALNMLWYHSWKLPLITPSCSSNNAKNNFDLFYKIDCCAAIHGRIWMNNVPNESIIFMLLMQRNQFSCFNFETKNNI